MLTAAWDVLSASVRSWTSWVGLQLYKQRWEDQHLPPARLNKTVDRPLDRALVVPLTAVQQYWEQAMLEVVYDQFSLRVWGSTINTPCINGATNKCICEIPEMNRVCAEDEC